jgi:uncharacterized C2H2 Zn-finger protein
MENENEKFHDRIKKAMKDHEEKNMYVSEFDLVAVRDQEGLLVQCERCLMTFRDVETAEEHLEIEHKKEFIEQVARINGGKYTGEILYQLILLDKDSTCMEDSKFFQITTYPKVIMEEKVLPVQKEIKLVLKYKNVGKDNLSKYMQKLIDEGIDEDDVIVKLNSLGNFELRVRSTSTTTGN